MKSPSDVRKLQMLLEHSSLAITEQYLQFNDSDTRDLIED
jgi:site-specific recombinase XerD